MWSFFVRRQIILYRYVIVAACLLSGLIQIKPASAAVRSCMVLAADF
jgi:hypothetical protein